MAKKEWQMVRIHRTTWKTLQKIRDKIANAEKPGTLIPMYAVVEMATRYYDKLLQHGDRELRIVTKADVERMNRQDAENAVKITQLKIAHEIQSEAIKWLLNAAQPHDGAGGDKWRREILIEARKYAHQTVLKAYQNADEKTLQIVESAVTVGSQELQALGDEAALKQAVMQ